MARRNSIPRAKPTAAGRNASFPMDEDMSMAGIRSDQTEAATITPDAKPRSVFCTFSFSASLRRNTQAAPAVVPMNGINSPHIYAHFPFY